MDKRDLLTEAGTPLPTFDKDMGIIEKLDDEPNDVGGLTSFELKQKFDEGGKAVKTYLNETLLPAIQGGGGGGGLIGEKIQEHNVALDAHADIRQKITGDIGTHNAAPDAHQDIRQEIADNKADTDAAAQRADDHIADQNNPHQVTYEQVGADPAGAASAALTTALATAKGAVAAADCYDEAASATSNPNTWYVSKDTPRPSGEAGMTIDVRWQHGHAGGLGYNVTLIWGAPDAPDNETILSGISVTDGLTGEASIPTEGTIRYQLINQSGRLTWKYVSGPVLTRQFSSATSAAVADKLVPGLSLSYLPGMEIVVQLDDGNTADTMRLVPDEGPTLPVYGNAMETKTGVIPRGYICRLRNAEDHWQLMEQTQVIKAPTTPGTAGQILTQTASGTPQWRDGGGLDKAAEHWATVKVAETISSITDEATFRTHFYDLRKSQDRKYQFEITQGGVHENIVTGVGGRPSGADPRDRAFLYVDIPYSEAGGYIIHVTYELRDKTGLWEKSIYATLNSSWRDTGWIAAEDRTPLVVTVDKEGGGGYKADYNSSAILAAAQAHRAVIMRYTDTSSGLQTDVLLKGQDGGLPLFYDTWLDKDTNKVMRIDATVDYNADVNVTIKSVDPATVEDLSKLSEEKADQSALFYDPEAVALECIFHDNFHRDAPDPSKPWLIGNNGFPIEPVTGSQTKDDGWRLVDHGLVSTNVAGAPNFRLMKLGAAHGKNFVVETNAPQKGEHTEFAVNYKNPTNFTFIQLTNYNSENFIGFIIRDVVNGGFGPVIFNKKYYKRPADLIQLHFYEDSLYLYIDGDFFAKGEQLQVMDPYLYLAAYKDDAVFRFVNVFEIRRPARLDPNFALDSGVSEMSDIVTSANPGGYTLVSSPVLWSDRAEKMTCVYGEAPISGGVRAERSVISRRECNLRDCRYRFDVLFDQDFRPSQYAAIFFQVHDSMGNVPREPILRLNSNGENVHLIMKSTPVQAGSSLVTEADLDIWKITPGEWLRFEVVMHERYEAQQHPYTRVRINDQTVFESRKGNAFNDVLGGHLQYGVYMSEWNLAATTPDEPERTLVFDNLTFQW